MDILLPINVDMIDFLISYADDELRSLVRWPVQPSSAAFQITSDKTLFSELLEAHEISQPKTVQFDPADPSNPLTRSALQKLRFPVITKPSWGGGGAGMRVWDNHKDLLPYLETHSTVSNPLIVQEFITGHELGTALFCHEGKILYQTIQRKIYPWEENAFQPSKGLRFMDAPQVRDLAERVMGALRWSGIAQMDILVDNKTGVFDLLEINPRYWGSVLASQRMGVNFPEIACRRTLDLPILPIQYRQGKYITSAGYLHYLKERLLGRKGPDNFLWKESAFQELLQDPLPRIVQFCQRLNLRKALAI
jgi:predicted ATP-grasp superfamily ATP-dependent carboligase